MKYITVTADAIRISDEPATPTPPRSPPLWLQVAQWCLQSGTPATRLAIAQTFGITLRQASDIMFYITQRRQDVVSARRVVKVAAGGIRTATLEVSAIRTDTLPQRGSGARPRTGPKQGPSEAMRALALGWGPRGDKG